MPEDRVFTWEYGNCILPMVNIHCEDAKGSEEILISKDVTDMSLQEVLDLCLKKAEEWRDSR